MQLHAGRMCFPWVLKVYSFNVMNLCLISMLSDLTHSDFLIFFASLLVCHCEGSGGDEILLTPFVSVLSF